MDGKLQAAEIQPSWVNPDSLAQGPGPYAMSFCFDTGPLVRSIREFGLINAPCVTANPSGYMDIVTGHRRVTAVRTLKWSRLPCRDLTPLHLSPLHLLLLNLRDNLTTRSLNDVEKGMVLKRLLSHLPKEEVMDRYMPMLHLPSNAPLLDLLVSLEDAGQDVKEAIAAERVPLRNAKRLFALEGGSRDRVLEWLLILKLNSNQQYQFIDIITDISLKENKGISEILEENSMQALLDDPQRNTPQKAKRVLETLRKRRFPRLTQAEQAFHEQVAGLPLPPGITLRHPPFFEGSQYRLEASFRHGAELRKMLAVLAEVEDLDKVGDPWEPPSS